MKRKPKRKKCQLMLVNEGLIVVDRYPIDTVANCGVCGLELVEHRNPVPHTDLRYPAYYSYECPLYTEQWHWNIVRLKKEKTETASVLLRRLYDMEIEFLEKHRKVPTILEIDVFLK